MLFLCLTTVYLLLHPPGIVSRSITAHLLTFQSKKSKRSRRSWGESALFWDPFSLEQDNAIYTTRCTLLIVLNKYLQFKRKYSAWDILVYCTKNWWTLKRLLAEIERLFHKSNRFVPQKQQILVWFQIESKWMIGTHCFQLHGQRQKGTLRSLHRAASLEDRKASSLPLAKDTWWVKARDCYLYNNCIVKLCKVICTFCRGEQSAIYERKAQLSKSPQSQKLRCALNFYSETLRKLHCGRMSFKFCCGLIAICFQFFSRSPINRGHRLIGLEFAK